MNIFFWLAILVTLHVALTFAGSFRRGTRARSRRTGADQTNPERWPSVSVIIPAWQEQGTIERCIASLIMIDYPSWEAIVVAGGSDQTYQAAVDACKDLEKFHVISQLPGGKNAALNEGFKEACGNIIVLLDADSKVSHGWLKALVKGLGPNMLAATGRAVPSKSTPVTLEYQMEWISTYEVQRNTTLQGSGSIALDRRLIENLGGFPEDIKVGVDWDLDTRLASQGIDRVYCPDAVVETERPSTLLEYWRNEVRWRRAHTQSLIRNFKYFCRTPLSAFSNLYIYVLAWFSLFFSFALGIALLAGNTVIPLLWLLFVTWIILRRASLAIEVAAYTRSVAWLKLAWIPPLLLFLTFRAIVVATLSLNRTVIHFKGPRVQVSANIESN